MKAKDIDINLLERKHNVRQEKDEDINGLESSIDRFDILQPILVKPSGNGKYTIICGHRRVEAARRRHEATVPCIIRDDMSDRDIPFIQIVENCERKQMSAYELVLAFEEMKRKEPLLTNKVIAMRIGKPEQYVANAYSAYNELMKRYGEKKIPMTMKKKTAGMILNDRYKSNCIVYEGEGIHMKSNGKNLWIKCDDKETRQGIERMLAKHLELKEKKED